MTVGTLFLPLSAASYAGTKTINGKRCNVFASDDRAYVFAFDASTDAPVQLVFPIVHGTSGQDILRSVVQVTEWRPNVTPAADDFHISSSCKHD